MICMNSTYARFQWAAILLEEERASSFLLEEWAAGRKSFGLDSAAASLLQVGTGVVLVQDWASRELNENKVVGDFFCCFKNNKRDI